MDPRHLPKIGVMYDFRLPPDSGRSWADLARTTIDVCTDLDAQGVDGVWVTEHHFTSDAYLPSLLPMAAALAMRTEQCDIGTSVLLAPLHHPLEIAESASVVDNLARGRLILGMGLGYRPEELAAFGVQKSERARRMDETIEILLQSWSPEPVDFRGEHFSVSAVQVQPKPVQRPHPRLWLGARSVRAAQRAGRVASGVILAGGPEVRETFLEAAAQAGRDPASLTVGVLRTTVIPEIIGASHLPRVADGLRWRSSRYKQWYASAADLPQDVNLDSAGTQTDDTSIRTLDEELHDLHELAESGVDYVIYHGTAPGVDPRIFAPQWTGLVQARRAADGNPEKDAAQ